MRNRWVIAHPHGEGIIPSLTTSYPPPLSNRPLEYANEQRSNRYEAAGRLCVIRLLVFASHVHNVTSQFCQCVIDAFLTFIGLQADYTLVLVKLLSLAPPTCHVQSSPAQLLYATHLPHSLTPHLPNLCPLCTHCTHSGFACCTDDMFEIFVLFGQCLCCLLPLFVNRQLPCLHKNSRKVLLLLLMHHRNLWCAKERALGVQIG